jgi:TRAP-type C4-dicarboxylate transport system substrate-binding protein
MESSYRFVMGGKEMNNFRLALGRLFLVCSIGAVFAVPAIAAETYTLKLSTFMPPTYVVVSKVLTDWVREVDQKSGGRLKIEVYPAGQMGPPPRHFDMVRTGVADIAISSPGNTPGRFPLSEVIELPFLAHSSGISSEVLMDIVPDYLAKEYAGTHILWAYVTPPFQFNMGRKPIHKIDDLRGLRIREQSTLTSDILSALGAAPVNVFPGDVADALNKGTIDGALAAFDGVTAFQFIRMVKYATQLNVSTSTFIVSINDATYAKLPADLRTILDETTGRKMSRATGAAMDDNDATAKRLMTEQGVGITVLDSAELANAEKLAAPVTERYLNDLEAKGLPGRKLYHYVQEQTAKYEAQPPR